MKRADLTQIIAGMVIVNPNSPNLYGKDLLAQLTAQVLAIVGHHTS